MNNLTHHTRTNTAAGTHRPGIALVLVMIAVVIATVLAATFIASQSTNAGISRNVQRQATARAIAESAVQLAIAHVQSNDNWRTDHSDGVWVTNESLYGGTYTLWGQDGEDSDGDGVIEGDGDLADDPSDLLTLTAVGVYDGVSHTVRVVVTPGASAETSLRVLLVAYSSSHMTSQDTAKKALFESWGYTVTPISDGASQAAYDAAVVDADVIYVSEEANSGSVANKITNAPIGIVCEEGYMYDVLELASKNGPDYSGTAINVTDSGHYITSPFSTGTLTIAGSTTSLRYASGTLAPGAVVLAQRTANNSPTLAVVDTGGQLRDGSPAPARRVMMPTGGAGFDINALNDDGRSLTKRALVWAAAGNAASGGWASLDVGHFHPAGDTAIASGTFTVTAGGDDIWDRHDEFRFVYQTLQGDGELIARVTAVPNTDDWSKAGVMFRESLNDSSRHAMMVMTRDNGAAFQRRTSTGSSSANSNDTGLAAPYWVRIVRQGDTFRGYRSSSGQIGTWTQVGPDVTMNGMAQTMYVGLAVTSHDSHTAGAATFDNVTLTGSQNPSPQLIALYEFNQSTPPDPVLIHHWMLDDGSLGGGVAGDDKIELKNSAVTDSYDATAGAYGGANITSLALVATNSTHHDKIVVRDSSQIRGNAYAGVGGDPSSVIDVSSGAAITGTQSVLTADVSIPASMSAPGGMPADEHDKTFSSSTTFNTDRRFDKLTIKSSAIVTVSGNITVLCDDDFKMEDNAQIVIPAGSSLTLYVDDKFEIKDNAKLNGDSTATHRLYVYHIDGHDDVKLKDHAVLAGIVYSEHDVELDDDAQLYGSVRAHHNMKLEKNARMHLDTSLPTITTPPAADSAGSAAGLYAGALTGQPGQDGYAVSFSGSNQSVQIPHTSDMMLDQGTVAFWFKSNDLSGHHGLFSKDSTGYDNGGHLHIYTDGSKLRVRLQSDNSDNWVESSGNLATGTWYHVVFTFGPAGMKLYLNGAEVDSDSYGGGLGASSGGSGNTEPIALGANTWASGNGTVQSLQDYFNGLLDDVRMYDRPLDANQAANLHQGQPIGPSSGSNTVADTSGYGSPMDLTIQTPASAAWLPGGGLHVTANNLITSAGPAAKLATALTATNEMTLEVVFTPDDLGQSGPARIVSLSQDNGNRNFTFGQNDLKYAQRLRTYDTNNNGTPDVESSDALTTTDQHHVIVTYDGQNLKMYRNGSLELSTPYTGDLSTWDGSYNFILANEATNDRPWHGKLYRVAVYDRALDSIQTQNVFNGLPPGDPADAGALTFSVRWDEQP